MACDNETLRNIEQKISTEIMQRYGNDSTKEKLLYLVPYNTIAITTPTSSRELPVVVNDVVLAVKERASSNAEELKKIYELYDYDERKLAESDEEGRMSFERAIEDKIDDQIRKIREAGFEPAGMDSNGNLDSVFEMLGRQLVTMNEEQRERLEKSNERIPTLIDISKENIAPEVDDENEIQPDTKENENFIMDNMNNALDFEVHKIAKIDPGDAVFWENNPDIKTKDAYVVLTKDNGIRIVGENNGQFEEVQGFSNPSNEAGRTTVIRNDEDDLSDNTKNTYGSLQSTRNADWRYTIELGQYGEIKLLEQRKSHAGSIEESDKWVTREVGTNNTNFLDRNLEGHDNSENITDRTFRANSTNRDAAYYGKSNGKGGVSEVAETMKNHNDPKDFTMESLAADESLRVQEAYRMVEEELKDRGITMNNEEQDNLKDKLAKYIGNSEKVLCEEDAVQYANMVQIERRNKENPNKCDDEELSRLDEIAEKRENRSRK